MTDFWPRANCGSRSVGCGSLASPIRIRSGQWSLLDSVKRKDRIFVAAVAHGAFGEDAVAGDPVEGLGVGFLGVGLEHEALAWAPAAGVHLRVEALGEFVLVVVRVAVWAQVEVALRT